MAYATQDDLEKQLPGDLLIQLADDDGDGTADPGVVAEALTSASAEVDGYLARRYAVPLDPAPPLVRTLTVSIALWNLLGRRPGLEEPAIEKRYRAALDLLRLIARGDATLGVSPEAAGGGALIAGSLSPEDRIFTIGRPSRGTTGTLDGF